MTLSTFSIGMNMKTSINSIENHAYDEINSINPTDLEFLKVIGRGTFAQQVALVRHDPTNKMYVVKTLDKKELIRRNQVHHTMAEKKILSQIVKYPFIVQLFDTFQTNQQIHFILEFCQGGELFYHLQQQFNQQFTEKQMKFYAAEILITLKDLHANGIIYRDLKPENILLDQYGHVKLVDFGFAKQNMSRGAMTSSFCGSPEYLSPEMVDRSGHDKATDMWSFGCLCYELVMGTPPFQHSHLPKLFNMIRNGRVWYPSTLSQVTISFISSLLQVDPMERLSAKEAMKHPFFHDIDWNQVLQCQLTPPIVPTCQSKEGTENFDDGFTNDPVMKLKSYGQVVVKSGKSINPTKCIDSKENCSNNSIDIPECESELMIDEWDGNFVGF